MTALAKVLSSYSAINRIARTFQVVLTSLEEQMEWIGTVFLGGLDLRSGVFKTFVYVCGMTHEDAC